VRMGILSVLGLIFVILKLTHYVNWGWAAVLSPFFLSLVFWSTAILYVAIMQVKRGQ
jgi:hypothetical protein